MGYEIRLTGRVLKSLRKLPAEIVERFYLLSRTLEKSGPTGAYMYRNYSKLDKDKYHCHITYHYVACWRHEKNTIIIEVYYVGSRENAPY
jgi:mRNA-degrading endonuclease RelE of RelBE toxin-antitoxin system